MQNYGGSTFMNNVSIQAHFDGKQILLDESIKLEPNTKLIVTILPKHNEEDQKEPKTASEP